MKTKIKEALQQGYKNLGLSDEALERVAASVETFVADEADIQKYVESELVKSLMKFEQADADRKRTKREKPAPKNADNEAEAKEGDEPQANIKQNEPQVDYAKVMADAIAAALKPLQDKLESIEKENSHKSAIAALDDRINTWDYAKGYPNECEDARERVMDLYEATGKTWDADKIVAEFDAKFNRAVSKKGVDTSKPFKSEDSAENDTPDYSSHIEMLKSQGIEIADK